MTTEKENTTHNDKRSNQPMKQGGQQNQNSDKKQYDSKTDQSKQGSGMNQPKSDRQDEADVKRFDDEQVTKPIEYKKDDQQQNERSERV